MERHKEQRDTEAHRAGKRKENGLREAEHVEGHVEERNPR